MNRRGFLKALGITALVTPFGRLAAKDEGKAILTGKTTSTAYAEQYREEFIRGFERKSALEGKDDINQTVVAEFSKPVERATVGMEIKRSEDGLIRKIHALQTPDVTWFTLDGQ